MNRPPAFSLVPEYSMNRLVECVPNFSEGRDRTIVQALLDTVASTDGTIILNHSMDHDHHRSVLTFCGTPEAVVEAAFQTIRVATNLIDLRHHAGVHPRVGATDVVPLIPIKNMTMEDCVRLAKQLGERVGRELKIPVFLYERAASRPDRARLEAVRRGGTEGLAMRMASDPGWLPDFGPTHLHERAGAIAIGARPPLIAYNVNLRSQDIEIARSIAKTIRQSNGGLPHVKAIGVELASRGLVQVSMNLTDYRVTPVHVAFQAVVKEAATRGIEVAGSELIGLIPQAAVDHTAATALRLDRLASTQVLETRIAEAMSTAKYSEPTLSGFLNAVAEAQPTPAGGSVAALVGALAASLGVMGARLVKQPDSETTLLQLSQQLHDLIQKDTWAYEALIKAYKIPKEHPDRPSMVADALQQATKVPLEIAERACDVARLLHSVRQIVKPTVYSDLTVGIILALATADAGIFTAQTNINNQIIQHVNELIHVKIIKIRESLEELRRLC